MAGIHNAIIGTAQSFGPSNYTISIVLVSGGGGGGYGVYNGGFMYYTAGGGGAGGQYIGAATTVTPGVGSLVFSIGAGGIGGDPFSSIGATYGGDTNVSGVFSANAAGGGPGASFSSFPEQGGGGIGGDSSLFTNAGALNSFTGYSGGDGYMGVEFGYPGGGGGGSGAGGNGDSSAAVYPIGGNGGAPNVGVFSVDFCRGGGGGAGGDTTTYPGPNVGGNAGMDNSGGWYDPSGAFSQNGGSPLFNGHGGGGGSSSSAGDGFGGNGAPGVAVVFYPGAQRGTGGIVSSSGGFTYHVFETSGTYTP